MDSYDEVLYPSYTHNQTHPDRLSVISRLFGLKPAPVARCRVLELGCGDGSNLIPMAFCLRDSEFVGIDRANLPIEKGRLRSAQLGLVNISLTTADLLETSGLGEFDYIIAHGLYSWVPGAVRDKLLELCKTHLKPQGVTFISYSCYPGGHLRDMLRQMMLFHVRNFSDPQQRINQSVALLQFLTNSQTKADTYTGFLNEQLEKTLKLDQAQLYHDQLSPVNTPVYFHQFVSHAAQHDLQFLAEAAFFESQSHIYPPETVEILGRLAGESVVLKEQYLDFLKCRGFRQTLLCHAGVEIRAQADARVLTELYLATAARPLAPEPDLRSKTVEEFVGTRGARVATDYPLAKAALAHLASIYPMSSHYADLLTAARDLSGANSKSDDEAEALVEILLHTYATGLLEAYPRAPDYTTQVSARPIASRLARLQVESDTMVTNLRHSNVEVGDELGRQLLMLLDGTRDRDELVAELTAMVESGNVLFEENGTQVRDSTRARESVAQGLEQNLAKLAKLALLAPTSAG